MCVSSAGDQRNSSTPTENPGRLLTLDQDHVNIHESFGTDYKVLGVGTVPLLCVGINVAWLVTGASRCYCSTNKISLE